jgi:hypothetical protein
MKISEAIAQLQQVLAAEGDLEMFDDEGYSLNRLVAANELDHCFPPEWDVPSRFLRIALDK